MSNRNQNKQVHAWFALRRTLPPWSFESNLRELVVRLPEYKVDELIVKVDTEEFFHGQIPLDWLRNYQPKLFQIKAELEKIGVVYSLNPWITQGHTDRGRDAEAQLPGIVTMVGHDGAECTCCACPLSEVWRRNTVAAWQIYAATRPHIIWVEDDIRTFNHGPARYGCFCGLHLKRFSNLAGEKVSRERLVAALTAAGASHPWRRLYLDMQAEIMIDTAGLLAKTVHAVAPETCLGLMSSGPENHCLEGRRWRDFAEALAGGRPLYSRPPMGNYNESNLRDLCYCPHSIKITRHCLPAGAVEQTEVENFTFTRYSKSSVITFLQMAISFAYGSHAVTMNLFDHMGAPMELAPEYGKMLARRKPFLEALAKATRPAGSFNGIRLLHHDKSSYCKVLPENAGYGDLAEDGFNGAMAVEGLGIANAYDDAGVTFAFGQTIRAFSDAEIKAMLAGGLLLDAVAANALAERGFAAEIGLKSIAPPQRLATFGPFTAEEYFNPDFGGHDKKFMTLIFGIKGGPAVGRIQPLPGAAIITCLADPDAQRHDPLTCAFENRLGGRVAVLALDMASAVGGFFNPFRRELFHNLTAWLSRGKPPLLVSSDGAYAICWRKDCGHYTIAGAFNLALDPWHRTVLSMACDRPPRTIRRLNGAGRWLKAAPLKCSFRKGLLTMEYSGAVNYSEPLILMLE